MAKCAFAIVQREQKLLLVKIASPFACADHWNFPGGVVELNEDLQIGAEREVLEETGIVCKVTSLVESFNTTNPDNEIFIFKATYDTGKFCIQEREIQEAAWFTPKEALELPLAFDIRDMIVRVFIEENDQQNIRNIDTAEPLFLTNV